MVLSDFMVATNWYEMNFENVYFCGGGSGVCVLYKRSLEGIN